MKNLNPLHWFLIAIAFMALGVGILDAVLHKSRCEEAMELSEKAEEAMTLYQQALKELKRREGYSDTVYVCPAGHKTVGYGLRITYLDSIPGQWSEHQRLLQQRFLKDFAMLQKKYPGYKRHQYLAMTLLRFNIGNFGATLHKALLSGDEDAVVAVWGKYNKYRKNGKLQVSPNLTKARQFEIQLFTGQFGMDA